MSPTINPKLGSNQTTTVDGHSTEVTTAVDTALRLLRSAIDECRWTYDALAAHLQATTRKKYDKALVWRVLNGERPLSLEFLVALPDDVEACFEAKRAEQFGHVVVAPLAGQEAMKALVAGLFGVMGLPAKASHMAKAGVTTEQKSEVA